MSQPQKKVLILETTSKHWRNTEHLTILFNQAGWKVSLYINEIIKQSLTDLISTNPSSIKWSTNSIKSLVKILFFQSFDLVIVSSSVLVIKYYNKNLKAFVSCSFEAISIIIFLLVFNRNRVLIQNIFIPEQVDLQPRTNSLFLRILGKIINSSLKKRINGYNVFGSVVKEILVNKYNIDKPIFIAPSALFIKELVDKKKNENDKLLIVIPGRIDKRRREYDWVEYIDASYKSKLNIVLLGSVQSEEDKLVIDRFVELGFKQPNFITGDFIKHNDFESYMIQSDFFFFPMKTFCNEFKLDVNRDFGPYSDAIRYGKIILTPTAANVDDQKSINTLRYQDVNELLGIIYKLFNDIKYRVSLQELGRENAKQFLPGKSDYIKEIEILFN